MEIGEHYVIGTLVMTRSELPSEAKQAKLAGKLGEIADRFQLTAKQRNALITAMTVPVRITGSVTNPANRETLASVDALTKDIPKGALAEASARQIEIFSLGPVIEEFQIHDPHKTTSQEPTPLADITSFLNAPGLGVMDVGGIAHILTRVSDHMKNKGMTAGAAWNEYQDILRYSSANLVPARTEDFVKSLLARYPTLTAPQIDALVSYVKNVRSAMDLFSLSTRGAVQKMKELQGLGGIAGSLFACEGNLSPAV